MQILLALGVSFLGSALIVAFRDMRFVVPLGLQLWMYLSPIAYPLSSVPERFRFLYMLNPMAGIIDSYRRLLLGQSPQWEYLLLELAIIVSLFLYGYFYFKRKEASFADII
jgi:lipopolysaccharide transport system permease protein